MSASAPSPECLYFSVPDMGPCCVKTVEETLCQQKEIASVEVDVTEKRVRIKLKENQQKIDTEAWKQAITDAGYRLIELDYEAILLAAQIRSYWYKALLAGTVGLSLFIFCALGCTMPMLAMYILAPCCSLILFYVGYDVFLKALKEFWAMQFFTMNSLFTVSTLSLLTISIIALCMPALRLPLFFDAVLMIFFFFYLGKIIQESANKMASQKSLREIAPKKTNKIKNFKADQKEFNQKSLEFEEVETKRLTEKDYIFLKSGETVPVNCKIIKLFGPELTSHQAMDNTDTGDQLKECKKDDELLAGAKISQGQFILQVIATEEKSQLAQLDNALKQQLEKLDKEVTINEKTDLEKIISNNIRYFVPIIFLLALITGLIIGFLFTPMLGVQIGLSVLIAICPCMLGLIAPLATRAAQRKAENYNLIIQQALALEIIKKVTLFIFDLNGTLTTGKYSVDEKASSQDYKILKHFYNIEKESNHNIARAICDFVKPKIEQEKKEEENCFEAPEYQVGNGYQIEKLGIEKKSIDQYKQEKNLQNQSGQIIFLTKTSETEKEIIGHIVLTDTLRPEAPEVIRKLKAERISVKVFTGSDESHALPLVEKLGLTKDDLQANCSNDKKNGGISKSEYVTKLEKKGNCVAVVVDQINDILAIHSEDPKVKRLSIAVNSANSYIQDRSQVAISPEGSLKSILTLFDLSQQFVSHVKQNLALNFICNLIAVAIPLVLLFTLGFILNPAWVAGLVVLQSVLVLANVGWFYYKGLPGGGDSRQTKVNDESLDSLIERSSSQSELSTILSPRRAPLSPRTPILSPRRMAG